MQTAGGPQSQAPATGGAGGWFANIGKGFGGAFTGAVPEKEAKHYQTCLTHMKQF